MYFQSMYVTMTQCIHTDLIFATVPIFECNYQLSHGVGEISQNGI